MQKTIIITLALGILSMLGIFMSHLALTDIFHGEADLTLEWKALQISFLAIVTFHASAIYTLIRILRLRHTETTAWKHCDIKEKGGIKSRCS